MIMDPYFPEVSDLVNGFEYDDENYLLSSDQYPDFGSGIPLTNGFNQNPYFLSDPHTNNLASSSIPSPPSESSTSPTEENDSSDPVLRYINQILMEERMEERPCMFYDPLALQQTEAMLYQVIGGTKTGTDSPKNSISSRNSNDLMASNGNSSAAITSTDTDVDNFVDSWLVSDPLGDSHSGSNLELPSSNRPSVMNNGSFGSSVKDFLIKDMFSDTESVLQFKKGLEEASKFLPSNNQLIINPGSKKNRSVGERNQALRRVLVKEETNWSRGCKNHEREKTDLDEIRSRKQTAVHVEDSEVTEMFDNVLLLGEKYNPFTDTGTNSSIVENQSKKQGKKNKDGAVDFRTLLMLCARAVSAGDKITAHELLKQIRQQSSPLGDGSQRVAHCFANALEARLAGTTGAEIQDYYNSLTANKTTAADILKAYQVYLTATPFISFIYSLANKVILDAVENASVLHIVDFGILYGFQWPMLIKHISRRKGGPPKLRITGIELPQCGFRPTERIEQTGRRLAKYCERFGVPFEYNPIASQNWGSIRIDDLKICRNEILVVNAMHRFKNLLDETAYEENCPRDAVLKLIREMNPDMFIHSIINGSYNAPFFLTRFKEALFYFSALFDIFENMLPRENEERLRFERVFHGREAMNVIASEGLERVERPETYKQWQARTVRAGFRQKRVDHRLIEKFRGELKMWHHKDFVIDEDGEWFLQGWKGRILYATTCWVPA